MSVGSLFSLSFGSPLLLVALVVIPLCAVAYLVWERGRARRASAWASPGLLANMALDPGSRRFIPTVLYLLAASLFLVAFARPRTSSTQIKPGATIVFAIDDSGSMAATDVAPSRLRAADAAITQFIDQLPSTVRVALVTFSSDYELKVPPTYDHRQVIAALPTVALQEGTALGDAVVGAVEAALGAVGPIRPGSARPPAAVLVASDGGQDMGQVTPAKAGAAAKSDGVPVSTLVVGTDAGTVNQKFAAAGSKQSYTETFQVPVEPADLRQIASTSGGVSYELGAGAPLDQLARQLGSHLVSQRVVAEITAQVTAAGAVALVAAALLSGIWFRRLI